MSVQCDQPGCGITFGGVIKAAKKRGWLQDYANQWWCPKCGRREESPQTLLLKPKTI